MKTKRIILRTLVCISGCASAVVLSVLVFGVYKNFGHLLEHRGTIAGLLSLGLGGCTLSVALWELQNDR